MVWKASLFQPTGTTSYSSNNLAYFWPSQNSGDRWWRIPLRLSVKFKMRKLKKRFTPYFLLRYRLEYPIKFSDKIRKEWNTSACSAADPTGLPEHKQSFIQVRNMAWSGCQSTWQWRLGSGSWWFSIMQILISRTSAGIFATGISRLSLLLLLLGLPSLVLIRRFTIPWGVGDCSTPSRGIMGLIHPDGVLMLPEGRYERGQALRCRVTVSLIPFVLWDPTSQVM